MNAITALKNDAGQWVGWNNGLGDVILRYFRDLFSSTDSICSPVLDCISSKLSADQNSRLLLEVEIEEVKHAVFQMHPDKAPGPDGFNPGFFFKSIGILSG